VTPSLLKGDLEPKRAPKSLVSGTTEPKIENPQICPYMSIYGYIEKQKDLYIEI
jgi:hypothetical protein